MKALINDRSKEKLIKAYLLFEIIYTQQKINIELKFARIFIKGQMLWNLKSQFH